MLVFHGSREDNKIALTFDDGPNPYGTRKVLAILDEYKIKATFFLTGKLAKQYPEIAKETKKKGHLIGNHGYSHSHYKRDMKKSANEIFKATETFPNYIRPPYGHLLPYIPEILSKRFRVIIWDVSSDDWASVTENEIFNRVINRTKNGSIILFHDGREQKRCKEMLKALPKIIEVLKRKYKLVRLDKMKF